MEEFIQQEIEVYIIKDLVKMRKILKKHPDSIIFVNIFEGMPESEWETWIRSVLSDAALKARIGIISPGEDETLKRKYLNQVGIQCGFTVIKSDLLLVMKRLFDILKAENAKGRRKYLRAITDNEPNAMVNLPMSGTFVHGHIKDISVVGFSCFFDSDPELAKNSLFSDIQIKLQTTIIKAEGIVFGSRMDGTAKIYVVLFTQRIDPEARVRIRRYIQSNLQAKMNSGV